MKAELKRVSSGDYPITRTGELFDPLDAWVILEAEVGPKGREGADIFFFYVCTSTNLKRELEITGFRFGRHLLIVNEFDWNKVVSAIEKLISSFDEPNWTSLAEKIGRYGAWEYEDYREVP
jgi:Immunity protein 8